MTGKTAAELIHERADASAPNMGLTSWKSGRVNKTDVRVAKNYLREGEIDELNRIVVMWLDFAEDQARRRKEVFLKDWEAKLNDFLEFNEREALPDAGSRSQSGHARANVRDSSVAMAVQSLRQWSETKCSGAASTAM